MYKLAKAKSATQKTAQKVALRKFRGKRGNFPQLADNEACVTIHTKKEGFKTVRRKFANSNFPPAKGGKTKDQQHADMVKYYRSVNADLRDLRRSRANKVHTTIADHLQRSGQFASILHRDFGLKRNLKAFKALALG